MPKEFEVVIVGGSIAGSSLALHLAQAGISAALVDKATFPRRKACGEGLSDLALNNLHQLGLAEELLSRDHNPFYGYRAHLGEYHIDIAYKKNRESDRKGIGVQRHILDDVLIQSVKKHELISLFLGKKVTQVEVSANGHKILVGGDILHARYLVLADGSNSVTASRLGIPCKHKNSASWGVSSVFEGELKEPLDRVSVFVNKGFEIYITPVSTHRINVCILAKKSLMPWISDPKNAQAEIEKCFEQIGFKGEAIDSPLSIGPVGSSRRAIYHNRVLLVGDALESLDPISGMGMTHGLITSELVAKALKGIICDGAPESETFLHLAKQRNISVRPFRGFSRLTGVILRGTRNHGKILEILSKTSLPARMREDLRYRSVDSLSPKTAYSTLLAIAGL